MRILWNPLGSGIPAGINIPNYNEIRQKEGFKNVNLGNRVRAGFKVDNDTNVPFLSKEDVEYMKKFRLRSFEIKGGFQLLDLIITELKSHMTCWKSQSLSLVEILSVKKNPLQDLLSMQSECCNFNQWEALNYNRSCDF